MTNLADEMRDIYYKNNKDLVDKELDRTITEIKNVAYKTRRITIGYNRYDRGILKEVKSKLEDNGFVVVETYNFLDISW